MSRRVRLRPGVHAAPVPGGLSISGLGRTAVVAADPAEWDALFPALHAGSVTGPSALVTTLDGLGLLLDPDARPAEADRFPRIVSYLEAYCASPYEAFQRLRAAVAYFPGGSGPLLDAVRQTLDQSGVGRLVVGDPEPDASVVITVDSVDPPGGPWIGIWLAGDNALVGPTLADAVRRLRSPMPPAPVSPVVAKLAGSLAGFAAVLAIAGVDAGDRHDRVQLIRTDGLRISTHPTAAAGQEWADLPSAFIATPAEPPYPGAPPPPPIACDPLTGSLPAPALVAAEGVPAVAARCGDRYAIGPDPATALRRAFAAAARALVPLSDPEFVAAAGSSLPEFWRDALLGCVARWEQSGRTDRLAAITGLAPRTPLTDAQVVTYRITAPGDVFATTVRSGGRLLAVDCSTDAQSSLDGAATHAASAPNTQADPAVHRDAAEFDARAVLGDGVRGRWWRGEPLFDDDLLAGGVTLRKDVP